MLGRDLVMVPKLIHPLPPNEPRTPTSSSGELEEEPPTPHPINDTWMQVIILYHPLLLLRLAGSHWIQGPGSLEK